MARGKYDEKQKVRQMRYNSAHRENLNIGLPKGKKDEYKALAIHLGFNSLTDMIVSYLEMRIQESGFVYEPETEESADE